MKEPPSSEEIEEAAVELAVDPSFVEKDWYAVQALELVVAHSNKNIPAVFSGGTSLSKGFGLIQRFSEDLDFIIYSKQAIDRADRRAYKQSIIQEIRSVGKFRIKEESIQTRDEGNFFSFDIDYPQSRENHQSLRPFLKVEMSYRDLSLPTLDRTIRSFLGELKKETAGTLITCVLPAETGTDKFNALIWRVLIKDRGREVGSKWNEPQLMRHLHDLCALEKHIEENKKFSEIVNTKFPNDAKRGGFKPQYTSEMAAKDAIEMIENDKLYRDEYTQFVKAMSYAPESERIDFDRALDSLRRISNLLS